MTPMSEDERDRLIDDLLDGDIAESDFLRLEAEMIVDEEARAAYYDRQKLQTGLTLDAEEYYSDSSSDGTSVAGRPNRFRLDPLILSAAATLAVLVGLLGWKIGQDTERARVVRDGEPVVSGFGVVAGPVGGKWNGKNLREGDLLPEGELVLESGMVVIELFSGVELLVEGPATFEVRSGMEVKLTDGKLQARVPRLATGFTITTTEGEVVAERAELVVDLGKQSEEVQVVDGSVNWKVGDLRQDIGVGEGFRFSKGEFFKTDLLRETMGEIEASLASQRDHRRVEWEKRKIELQEDSRLLFYFDGSESKSPIPDHLAVPKEVGTIVRADRASDRWGRPGGALDFSPTGSRVRVDIPGEHESLTLMCWVKIDGLDRWYNSLFLTDGHELHEPHWQIMDDGRIFFSVRARDQKGKKDKHIAYSPPIWTPAQSGQWMHLATTYDGEKQTITHYVNGEAISIDQIPEELQPDKVVIGPASIANWSEPKYRSDAEFVMRNLNGAIDEFLVFGAALGAGEIEEIFEAGMP